ncbi:MAG: class I SAM-dependent methyltransferase [Bacteroidia bacterium]|nr:class I SAM-dependent methyltransferase [Bacteroidia bacterium]NND11851.1 class I SAM-dependent methyltransferase [Flavobacteriaceae bacterium]NNK26611.1 class I SAM-dependent methyltransferase [Flavobacteriaceae bacterium]
MNKHILNTTVQDFINNYIDKDVTKVLFRKPLFKNVSNKELVEQIEAKKKCRYKLPTWYGSKGIYYPNKLSIEQASSETTAEYKSMLIDGNSLIDLTGGFGVDSYYFSKRFNKVIHCEMDTDLSNIARNNFNALNIGNVTTRESDGIDVLKGSSRHYDWIYIDPSRRHKTKGKVFFLRDCSPNVPDYLDDLFMHSDNILVKTSPLLDIKAGIKELHSIKSIHIVATNNELKELLWILQKDYSGPIAIKTINLINEEREVFSFSLLDETDAKTSYSQAKNYLYAPNRAILKSGAFRLISERYKVDKLHPNTHLYTSDIFLDFPGRRFKIDKVLPYNKKLLKKEFLNYNVNVSTRNFPDTVEQIKKKLNLKDGGTIYMFFITNINEQKEVLVCSKV